MNADDRYAVLIRHGGFCDQFARREPKPDKDAGTIDAWISWSLDQSITFATPQEAEEHRQFLTSRFATERYRFSLIERRLMPSWFLLNPEHRWERGPVGSVDQL